MLFSQASLLYTHIYKHQEKRVCKITRVLVLNIENQRAWQACRHDYLGYLFIYFYREKGEGERETSICCSTYSCTLWLTPVCTLPRDRTRNLGILGQCSNQLSYLARAYSSLLEVTFPSSMWSPEEIPGLPQIHLEKVKRQK